MIKKRILNPGRIRRIAGGFSYIPHRFLTGGFLAFLEQKEIRLYLFLILVAEHIDQRPLPFVICLFRLRILIHFGQDLNDQISDLNDSHIVSEMDTVQAHGK